MSAAAIPGDRHFARKKAEKLLRRLDVESK
jgi:hypothetical protein